MAGITGPVAVAIWVSATTTRSGNRSRPHIAQLRDLRLNGRTAILQGTQRIGHVEPPKAERSATLGFRAQATESCGSAILCRAPDGIHPWHLQLCGIRRESPVAQMVPSAFRSIFHRHLPG